MAAPLRCVGAILGREVGVASGPSCTPSLGVSFPCRPVGSARNYGRRARREICQSRSEPPRLDVKEAGG